MTKMKNNVPIYLLKPKTLISRIPFFPRPQLPLNISLGLGREHATRPGPRCQAIDHVIFQAYPHFAATFLGIGPKAVTTNSF